MSTLEGLFTGRLVVRRGPINTAAPAWWGFQSPQRQYLNVAQHRQREKQFPRRLCQLPHACAVGRAAGCRPATDHRIPGDGIERVAAGVMLGERQAHGHATPNPTKPVKQGCIERTGPTTIRGGGPGTGINRDGKPTRTEKMRKLF